MGIKKLSFFTLILVFLLSSCGQKEKDAYVTVGDQAVSEAEVMVYILQTYNDFIAHGGDDVWSIQDFSGGKSAAQVAKQGAMDNIIRVKVLVDKARELGMALSDDEEEAILSEAGNYFSSMLDSYASKYEITEETVQNVFMENRLAALVEEATMIDSEVAPETVYERMAENEDYAKLSVLDTTDLLTTYQVQHIAIYTKIRHEDGTWSDMPEEDLAKAVGRVDEVYERIQSGEDFVTLARLYSEETAEDVEGGIRLSKAQLPDNFINAIERAGLMGISVPIKGDYGYHIFKVLMINLPEQDKIDDYQEKFAIWEAALYSDVETAIIKEAFDVIYKRWAEAYPVTYSDPWMKLEILSVFEVTP